jgi:hypothetical protein
MPKTKTTKKAATAKATKSAKAAPAKKAPPAKITTKSTPKADAPSIADPCAAGHQWDTDGDGVEFCTTCKADRKEVEKAEKKAAKSKDSAGNRPTATSDKKLSAIDAAAKVLGESKEPMNAKQMIDAMSTKGYWTSPGGKTPHATLYSAILREITVKGKESRFVKADRGQFTVNA